MSKRFLAFVTVFALAATLCLLSGCGGTQASQESSDSGSSASTGTTKVVVGTLATEDILPYWVASNEGLFASNGLDVEVVTFQSATELISGVTSGDVDMAMTDIMVTSSIYASGTDVQIEWVTLGTDASQGRFGIMTSDPSIKSLSDLAGKEIGVGSNTILEYVMDKLMEQAGVSEDQILKQELQKLPVRYQTMASGQVAAAALPGSLLALGEANGCYLVADDTQGENLSQSVMIARTDFVSADGAGTTLETMKKVWDTAVEEINANPEQYRETLVQNANLSDDIAQTYPISTYPTCQMPTQSQVDDILAWMVKKGYLQTALTYDASTGTFSK